MKVLLQAITIFFYVCTSLTLANASVDTETNTPDSLNNNDTLDLFIDRDSMHVDENKWPSCPSVESAKLIVLDEDTYLLKWEQSRSSKMECHVQILNGNNFLEEERNNSGVYIFQLDRSLSKEDISINLTTVCYYDFDKDPIMSEKFEMDWSELRENSSDYCDAYEELISMEELRSFYVFGTELPIDANYTFDICQKEECHKFNHDKSNSAILQKLEESYSILNPKLFTKFGNYTCDPSKGAGASICEIIEVTELENCLYEISYSPKIAPVCDLGLYSHQITHSLCGHATGRIVVRAKDGNEPYHYSWSTGDEGYENDLNYLLPGTYTVTVTDITGCQIVSNVTIQDNESVNFYASGGDGGLEETVTLPAGMYITWKFDPIGVTDQFTLSGQSLNVDTGPITNGTESGCGSNSHCSCSLVFMGDYNNGDALPIAAGNAYKAYPFAEGIISVPNDGVLNLNVIGANCGSGTGWSLKLECTQLEITGNQNGSEKFVYTKYPNEIASYIETGVVTQEQFEKDSTIYFNQELKKEKSTEQKLLSQNVRNNTTILDFRCSGFVASPYSIRMENVDSGEIVECDIIEQVSCPECDEETDGCQYLEYKIESDPWDPYCLFSWKVDPVVSPELEIVNENGDVVLQSSDFFGEWEVENGKSFTVNFSLENDSISTVCSFELECAEPDLPPIDENICEFFATFGISLENESSLYFSSEANLTPQEIENFNLLISQISTIQLAGSWYLGPDLKDILLFDANNGGVANLFQLDPENMTFIIDNYDMNDVWNQILQGETFSPDERLLNFKFKILDIHGNITYCEFATVIEFPEEEEEDDNPLCLSCESGDYDPSVDLEGYTLAQGHPYTGSLNGKTVYIYGFPIHITAYNTSQNVGEGILALPFEECKVLAVKLNDLVVVQLPIEKELWITSGDIQPHDTYPGQLPDFNLAPDFEFGAEICVPPRASNDVDGDGIDDETKLDEYGFDSNGNHINGTKFDNNGFDSTGNYMGCPRTDDPNLECTEYNEDGCNRDGLNESGEPCPAIDDEEWDDFVDEFEESSDSLIAAIVCDYAGSSSDEKDEKNSECDSLRTLMDTYINDADLSQDEVKLVKGAANEYFLKGLSGHFTSEPKVPTPAVGGRLEAIKNLEKTHVKLYYCDQKLLPLEDEASGLEDLCSGGNTSEIQSLIDNALEQLSNLDKQRLMLDENAFKQWIEEIIKEFLKEEHSIDIGAVVPASFEIDLFDTPTKFNYHGGYNSVASTEENIDLISGHSVMDAIDFEYAQGFDKINGVTRGFYVAQLGRYNQENYASIGGQEPIAIQNVQQSAMFSIYLVNFRFFPNSPALVDAYIELNDPKSDRKIYFSATDVTYNPNGIESATMELATTIGKFKISNAARGTILKGPGTYLDFDCEGVKEFGLKGEVEFCDNIIVPMQQIAGKNDYERHDDPYFIMGFETKFQEWLEFETKILANSPFAMAKQEDLIWIVPEFNFDFSSSSSDFVSGFNVPGGFNSEFVEGSSLGPGWKGFYCPSLSAVLPAITKSDNGDRFTAATVEDLLIDKYGVTCSAEVSTQILGLDGPNMKSQSESTGWSLSIDYFRLDAVQNFIVGGGLRGKILTSLFKDDAQSALDYSAIILPGQKYKFSVSPKVDLEVPLLVATAEIKRSAIDITYDAETEAFDAQAKFSGNIKINNNLASAALPYLKFTDLTVKNTAPYLTGGKWELKSNSSSGGGNEDSGSYKGFTFSLENLNFEQCEGGPVLSTTINVGFGLNGDNDEGSDEVKNSNLNISGDFGLRGKFEPFASGIQGFKFDKAFLNGLAVSGNIGEAVKDIDIKLCWDDDNPDYGDTFYGSGKASILNFGEVGVAAQFGQKDGEKYFFVDAFAEIPTIPIGGPIGINMIGVGVSKNMAMESDADGEGTPSEVPNSEICSPPACASNFGQTYTGFTYLFDASKSLAMRASVGFGMTTPPNDFIEGSAGIDITFNDGGGIDKFGFFGEATILANFPDKLGKVVDFINETPINKLGGVDLNSSLPLDLGGAKPSFSTPMPIMARVEGNWVFTSPGSFDLTAGAFLDWGVLKGAGEDNALALGKIYIGGGDWNVSLGTPSQPSGVIFNLGIVNASFKTYFMAGNPLAEPWTPYLPDKVDAFFGGVDDFDFLDDMPASGAGFAFGVHFEAGFNISVPILGSAYADLMAGIDVAMINGIKCNGNPIGFGSGWYAMGQAYLYAGAGLRILGVDLIKGEAGILMNAGLTNPSFFNGRLKVSGKFGVWPLRFNISGSINVELGNEPNCEWYVYDEGEVLEVLGELSIVESTFPTTGAEDVSTSLTSYLINYNVPMGEVLELTYQDTLTNNDIVDKTVEYKIDVSRIEFTSAKTGLIKSTNPTDNDDSDLVGFSGTFASDDLITVRITYNVEMKVPDSDNFIDAIVGEVIEYDFKTGPLELRFDASNIKGSWPENGMDNFYLQHRLDYSGDPQGIVSFKYRFPWEIFETPGIEVRTALYQGNSTEPLIDAVLDPTRYFNVDGLPTNAGSLFFDLPDEMGLGENFKVTIYATHDTSDVKVQLMDPIHFRTSLYYNLEEKFAESDSMFYVEASPRIGSEYIENVFYTYVCGYEYNLVSKDGAPESWDAFDAKYMKFNQLCDFDGGKAKPSINSTEFVDCEFEQVDEPPKWDSPTHYAVASVGDLLTTPNANNLMNSESSDTRAQNFGPPNVSIEEVRISYKIAELLHYKHGGFLLKSCQ